jgi:hypothetical protein
VDAILSYYDISEEQFGNYRVETMKIVIPGNVTAKLVPVGTYIIGGKGRVDLIGPNLKEVKLLLVPANMTRDGTEFQFKSSLSANDKTESVSEEEMEWTWKIATPSPYLLF